MRWHHPAMSRGLGGLAGLLVGALASAPAAGEPLDLRDTEPRWVAVRFEISPRERPEQTRSRFTRPLLGRLEPTPHAGELRIAVDARAIETHLFPGQDPAPGSFSDFVWIFDSETGHVRSATLAGTLFHSVGWGFASWRTETRFDARMDTLAPAGFRADRVLGEPYARLCHGPAGQCTVVEPQTYDPATGYVNAVGRITAHNGALSIHSFSPLGEAIFSEIGDPFDAAWLGAAAEPRVDVAAPPPAEAAPPAP